MKRVRIVGGGLTGILAALQAHRLGAGQIVLHERFDSLGGIALSARSEGRELREGCIYFGPQSDPIRSLLSQFGVEFDEFANRFGSVSPAGHARTTLEGFGGPVLEAASVELDEPRGVTLADRLACYEPAVSGPLERYVRWHVGCDPAHLHASAAIPLAINRIFPAQADIARLRDAKATRELANEMFGIPRGMWDYVTNDRASLPAGGFVQLLRQCRAALEQIGVEIRSRDLVTPRRALEATTQGETLVWAASPMPLFKPAGMAAPKAPARRFATYVFAVDWHGPVPFYIQNFTAQGSCFRAYFYESGGTTLLTAECVREVPVESLVEEIQLLADGFEGRLSVGELLHSSVKPRWLYHSVDTIARLGQLRTALGHRTHGRFVTGAWQVYAKGEKFADVEAQLRFALGDLQNKVA